MQKAARSRKSSAVLQPVYGGLFVCRTVYIAIFHLYCDSGGSLAPAEFDQLERVRDSGVCRTEKLFQTVP